MGEKGNHGGVVGKIHRCRARRPRRAARQAPAIMHHPGRIRTRVRRDVEDAGPYRCAPQNGMVLTVPSFSIHRAAIPHLLLFHCYLLPM